MFRLYRTGVVSMYRKDSEGWRLPAICNAAMQRCGEVKTKFRHSMANTKDKFSRLEPGPSVFAMESV
jgi:hypothetical protein